MELPSPELVSLFFKLLPGLLAATVFHALTPYPRRDIFDRLVAALIFTLIAELVVSILKVGLLWFGIRFFALGDWSEDVRLAFASIVGLLAGLGWAFVVNNDFPHRLLRKVRITQKTSLPTQWFSAFSKYDRYIILQFSNGRRLMGWPLEWPDEPENGHFLLQLPRWILDDGSAASMYQIEVFLVNAKEVEAVEFLRYKDDPYLVDHSAEIESARRILENHRKE